MTLEEPKEIVVWLVEDNDKLRRNLVALIESAAGMTCPLAVPSCEDALAALSETPPPDIVFMDLGLPGISGVEGTRRLRSLSPATRVIVLTIHAEDENVFQAVCAGASGYLLKPSPPDQILQAIHDVEKGAAPINGYIASKMLTLFSRMAPAPSKGEEYGLTQRERQILGLLVDGLTMKQIASELGVSFYTIDSHQRNIYEKLHVRSRARAVAKAVREDLL